MILMILLCTFRGIIKKKKRYRDKFCFYIMTKMEIIEIIKSHNKCIVVYGFNFVQNNIISIIFNLYKAYIRKLKLKQGTKYRQVLAAIIYDK